MDSRPGSFGAASFPTKVKIMLAGVAANFLAGIIILTILAGIGMPVLINDQFIVASDTKVTRQEVRAGSILVGSAATKTVDKSDNSLDPLRSQDTILGIKDLKTGQSQAIKTPADLREFTRSHKNAPVELTIRRDGEHKVLKTKLNDHLGLIPVPVQLQRSTWSSPIVALGLTKQVIVLTAKGLWHAVSGLVSATAGLVTGNQAAREKGQTQAADQAGGPVAIVAILWGSGELGINFILGIIAVISLTLAFINIMPVPALDGGRLFVSSFFRLIRKPLTPQLESSIHGAGMLIILGLFLLITIVDVKRVF